MMRLVRVATLIIIFCLMFCKAQETCDTCPDGYGWCPVKNKCIKGSPYGPTDEDCPADAQLGQFTYYKRNCKCLTATKCSDIEGTDCGWCPSARKAYIKDAYGIMFGLKCNSTAEDGQWAQYVSNCACLNAKTCYDIENVSGCGWCPSRGRAYLGDSYRPSDGITCPSDALKGQWTYGSKNCKCLTATSCFDIQGTDCGWCPSINRALLGNSEGPNAPLTCAADPLKGQWTYNTRECTCLTASTCLDIENTYCGWCPSLNRAFMGSQEGPSGGISCPADPIKGQWTYGIKNCKCLTATSCNDIQGTDCGWCPLYGRALIGSYSGPKSPLSCPPDATKGQWTIDTRNCPCLSAKNCTDIANTNCGWCPSLNKAFLGNEYKPDGLECPPDPRKGQWTYKLKNCKCITATSCKDIEDTDCGWCPEYNRALLGSYSGPSEPLTCPPSQEKGQWTSDTKNCKCLDAHTCTDILNTNCGWCPALNKSYVGDDRGPSNGLTCPSDVEHGQWTKNPSQCTCLTAKTCEESTLNGCGWCPSLNKSFIGDGAEPYFGVNCPASQEKGQWTRSNENCKCLKATSVDDIAGTQCGWCPVHNKSYIGSYNGPKDLTCPADVKGQWTFGSDSIRCFKATKCSDISSNYNCGWCIGLNRAYLGDWNGPYGVECPAGWIMHSNDCWKGVPSQISDLAVETLEATSVTLSWTPPNKNGYDLSDYIVKYSFVDEDTGLLVTKQESFYAGDAKRYSVKHLPSETRVNMTMFAQSIVGYGKESNQLIFTTKRDIVFTENIQGIYKGLITSYTSSECTETATTSVSLDVSYRSVLLRYGTNTETLSKCSTQGDSYFSCTRASTSEKICILLDVYHGSFMIQYGEDTACPMVTSSLSCTLDHFNNIAVSRIYKEEARQASFKNGIYKTKFNGYDDKCTVIPSNNNALVTYTSSQITVEKQNRKVLIKDIYKLPTENQYAATVDNNMVCLYTTGAGTVKIQYAIDGACPSNSTKYTGECTKHDRIDVYTEIKSKESNALYIAVAVVCGIAGIVLVVVSIIVTVLVFRCFKKHKSSKVSSNYKLMSDQTGVEPSAPSISTLNAPTNPSKYSGINPYYTYEN